MRARATGLVREVQARRRSEVQKKLGPAWTDRGRPSTGYFTKCTAEAWLRDVLDEARRGTPASMGRTGVTFAGRRGLAAR